MKDIMTQRNNMYEITTAESHEEQERGKKRSTL